MSPHRSILLCIASFAIALPALAAGHFADSPHTEIYPHPASCDVLFTPSNFASLRSQLNDADKRVFCMQPGDYRSAGLLVLTASGTQSSRRYLRFLAPDGLRNAGQRTSRALVEAINVFGSWWVIEQLTLQPRSPATVAFIYIQGGDHNTLDGNLFDGIEHANTGASMGVVVAGSNGNPGSYNAVQGNLIRNGNTPRLPVDYFGVLIRPGLVAGEDNDHNRVLDNEIIDWGDGVAVGGYSATCSEPGRQHGTVIDGNDIYVTAAKRASCATGAPDPNGECACAENGIDVKSNPGAVFSQWTRITNNRTWGFRPTPAVACGGSGSNGQAISAGSTCAGHTLVANNAVSDAVTGISIVGPTWIVAGNLLHDIRATSAWRYGSMALNATNLSSDLRIEFNTIVSVDTSYDNASANTTTRCNVVVDDAGWMGPGQPPGANHFTTYNYLYDSPTTNFPGSTNRQYASAVASENETYCYWRRRWTTPEQVCVPLAGSTSAGPHLATLAQCDPADLVAPIGLPPAPWVTAQPCDDGTDNDGDGDADAGDFGCAAVVTRVEDPACQNGRDDDGDGRFDFDGGASANGGTQLGQPDLDCKAPSQQRETKGCGLGFEVGVALALLARRRRQLA